MKKNLFEIDLEKIIAISKEFDVKKYYYLAHALMILKPHGILI
ncbi:MAG: hypothetical protein ACUZ8E_13395 [Candidatus Anammoxibacter sp.]